MIAGKICQMGLLCISKNSSVEILVLPKCGLSETNSFVFVSLDVGGPPGGLVEMQALVGKLGPEGLCRLTNSPCCQCCWFRDHIWIVRIYKSFLKTTLGSWLPTVKGQAYSPNPRYSSSTTALEEAEMKIRQKQGLQVKLGNFSLAFGSFSFLFLPLPSIPASISRRAEPGVVRTTAKKFSGGLKSSFKSPALCEKPSGATCN